MSRLAPERIDRAIALSTFHDAKARQPREIARLIANSYSALGAWTKCSTCPVLDVCRQVGVGERR
jgi:endonuclease III